MKNFKSILAVILALAMMLSLTGCMSSEEAAVTTEAAASDTTTAADATTTAADATTTEAAEDSDDDLDYFDASKYCDNYGWYLDFDALAVTTLPELEGIVIPYDTWYVSDEEVQTAIDEELEDSVETVQVTDRAVEDGDSLNIDYVGKIDGEEFSGGNTNGAGVDVTIGVTSYIDDFLEQLIGHMPGETFDIEVTFPDPYTSNTDLSGKDAVFTVTINYITEEQIPEFTDEYVSNLYSESMGWNTMEDMRNGIREIYESNNCLNYLDSYILENSTVSEIPEIADEYWRAYSEWYVRYNCAYYGQEVDDYLEGQGVADFDELFETLADTVLTQETYEVVFEAAAEKLEYCPTEEEVTSYFDDYYGTGYYEYWKQTVPQATLLKSAIGSIVTIYIGTLAVKEEAK